MKTKNKGYKKDTHDEATLYIMGLRHSENRSNVWANTPVNQII